jgi:hypothetical protein
MFIGIWRKSAAQQSRSEATMAEPIFQLLDAVNIDDNRQYIEFQFSDYAGERKVIQIDFDYLESLTGVFRQAFLSAVMVGKQGSNRMLGQDWVSVPRVDVDQPVNVGVDVMTGKVVTMLLLGSPFQTCYSLPVENARALARELLAACDEVRQHDEALVSRPPN